MKDKECGFMEIEPYDARQFLDAIWNEFWCLGFGPIVLGFIPDRRRMTPPIQAWGKAQVYKPREPAWWKDRAQHAYVANTMREYQRRHDACVQADAYRPGSPEDLDLEVREDSHQTMGAEERSWYKR